MKSGLDLISFVFFALKLNTLKRSFFAINLKLLLPNEFIPMTKNVG